MKRMTQVVSIVALAMALSAPAMAAQGAAGGHDANCTKECEMQVRNCRTEVDSLQQRIERLRSAINNHADSYSKEELSNLKNQLEETVKTLEDLEQGGA